MVWVNKTVEGLYMTKTKVGLNANNNRVGEYHQNSKLTDNEVELIRWLRDEGLTYSQIAAKFEVSKSCVAHICQGISRCDFVVRFKTVYVRS